LERTRLWPKFQRRKGLFGSLGIAAQATEEATTKGRNVAPQGPRGWGRTALKRAGGSWLDEGR